MNCKEAAALPFLDKSSLFLPLPPDPQNPNRRYLQCPATGHIYCMSTGSLYLNISQVNPLTTNISSLNKRGRSSSLPINPIQSTMRTDQPVQGNGASTTPSAGSDKSPNVSKASITDSNKAPNDKNEDQHMQDKGASTMPNTQSNKTQTVRHGDQPIVASSASITPKNQTITSSNVKSSSDPVTKNQKNKMKKDGKTVIDKSVHVQKNVYASSEKNSQQESKKSWQGKGASTTPNIQSNETPKAKHGHQPIVGSSASITPKNQTIRSSNVKSSSDPITKKQKNKMKNDGKTTKSKSAHVQKNTYASSEKNSQQQSKNEIKKQNKPIVLSQSKPTTSFIKKTSNVVHPTLVTRITPPAVPSMLNPVIKKQSKTHKHSEYKPFPNFKRKSDTTVTRLRYYIIGLQPMTNPTKPIELNLDHLLFPESATPLVRVQEYSQTSDTNVKANSIKICSFKPAEKPPLYLSREDHAMIDLESSFRKKTGKRNHCVKTSYRFNKIQKTVKPFNRRPHYHYKRKPRSLLGQYKNCIMAPSVNEIIHSRFAKNTNEHMPASQIKTMLSSGVRKLRTRQRRIKLMEEEAIHKYKELKHEEKLEVEEYDVIHHPEKSWLVSYGRCVINQKDKVMWPLLVKCIHKYPDTTLRQACKHRSFCLRWNGTSYTLRMDHAYYTQIQCHMAVTDSSYAELIVHTHKETTIVPVYFDVDFWKKTEVTLETFFTSNVLPYLKKVSISKLKNRSGRNVRIIGIPESYTTYSLRDLISKRIPELLRLKSSIKVERAHRRGARTKGKTNSRPRPVIARIPDYKERNELIQTYRKQGELKLDNNRIFIFSDYSVEVKNKRRAFWSCCSILIQKEARFSLHYPATLKLYHENGMMDTFTDPTKAMKFIEEKYMDHWELK